MPKEKLNIDCDYCNRKATIMHNVFNAATKQYEASYLCRKHKKGIKYTKRISNTPERINQWLNANNRELINKHTKFMRNEISFETLIHASKPKGGEHE